MGGPNTGGASTSFAYIVPVIDKKQQRYVLRGIPPVEKLEKIKQNKVPGEVYSNYEKAKLCLKIWSSLNVQNNDHDLAHEILIHDLRMLEEANKLVSLNLSFEKLHRELLKINAYSYYEAGDGGERDHFEFITGIKKEMTQYTLERLQGMKTTKERMDYLYYYLSEIDKYLDIKKHPNVSKFNNGRDNVKKLAKKYLEADFIDYKNYIFSPIKGFKGEELPNIPKNTDKEKSLWDIVVK